MLSHFLAGLYALSIIYASLQPFSPWIQPPPGTPFFLLLPAKPLRNDIIVNVLAYIPLGFFLGLSPRHARPPRRFVVAMLGGLLLSFVLEWLQTFLPPRDANVFDLLSNTAGAAVGGGIAGLVAHSRRARRLILEARQRWFLPGKFGDLGLALVALWLVVQVNPAIPLFASMFDPVTNLPPMPGVNPSGTRPDVAAALVEAAHSAFQLLGVSLFVALLVRERRLVASVVLLLIMVAATVKGIAAAVMLNPVVVERWLRPGVATGVAVGTLLLMFAIWLPRPVQVAVAATALLSSLLSTLLAPEMIFTRAPLAIFDWSYGQLLHFNGLTHTVLLLWPIAASVFLFVLAGRPGWGEPG